MHGVAVDYYWEQCGLKRLGTTYPLTVRRDNLFDICGYIVRNKNSCTTPAFPHLMLLESIRRRQPIQHCQDRKKSLETSFTEKRNTLHKSDHCCRCRLWTNNRVRYHYCRHLGSIDWQTTWRSLAASGSSLTLLCIARYGMFNFILHFRI